MVAAVKGFQWKIGLALAVIFLAGVGVGWVAGRRAIVLRQVALGRAEVWDGMILKRMEERLDLTAEQKAALAPMVRETAQRLQAQRRRAMLEQFQTVRGLYEQAEPLLTQPQRDRLAQSRQQLREKLPGDFPMIPPRPGQVRSSAPGPTPSPETGR